MRGRFQPGAASHWLKNFGLASLDYSDQKDYATLGEIGPANGPDQWWILFWLLPPCAMDLRR